LIGNPALVESRIQNYDARWEWFFSPLEVVSLSFFHKTFDRPIEQTVIAESSLIADSFRNAESAELTGFEFEGRKDFGFLGPYLRNLSVGTNFAYIDSTATIPRAKHLQVQTSTSRPLQGQAPYIANGILEWAPTDWGIYRLLYYTAGPRITAAGSFGLPDIQEERRDQLDFVVLFPVRPFGIPLTMKLSAENLLDDRILLTQGGHVQREYNKGVKMTLGFSYTYQ
jgi:hypothetical protein